ncbi:MAG: hypothetical protein SGARI_002720, partial [Bacillariaceae sp.]
MGADYFSTKIAYPADKDDDGNGSTSPSCDEKKEASIRQQQPQNLWVKVWDTPGRERYSMLDKKKARYTASFSDAFLKDVDAAVLVYDVSSSTSFTHVLKWHSELMERLQRMKASGERIRPLPILIVGNKIDIFEDNGEKDKLRRKTDVVQQRSVLGLHNRKFRGNDYRYEYTANQPSTVPSSASLPSSPTKSQASSNTPTSSRSRFELSTYMGTKTGYLESVLNNEVYRGQYLDSLTSADDKSFPDNDMVLLVCMRNGLTHMDVSAKRGIGIETLMQQLVQMAMEEQQKSYDDNQQPTLSSGKSRSSDALHTNDELDLHHRYAPKPQSCFRLP